MADMSDEEDLFDVPSSLILPPENSANIELDPVLQSEMTLDSPSQIGEDAAPSQTGATASAQVGDKCRAEGDLNQLIDSIARHSHLKTVHLSELRNIAKVSKINFSHY